MAEPGKLDLRIVSQDQVWVNIRGEEIAVANIDSDYAASILRYLERRAGRLMLSAQLERTCLVMDDSLSDGVYTALTSCRFPHDPVVWLRSTPLHRALQERVDHG